MSIFLNFDFEALPAPRRACIGAEKHTPHVVVDIRDAALLDRVFSRYGNAITAVIHTAAQPSHDWAASDPQTDFTVNANGTLNLLEATRRYSPAAAFVFTSTNKVYGDFRGQLTVNTRENVRLTFDHKVENVIQEIVETNFELYKRITDDPQFGDALKKSCSINMYAAIAMPRS